MRAPPRSGGWPRERDVAGAGAGERGWNRRGVWFLGVIAVASLVQAAFLVALAVGGLELFRRIDELQARLDREIKPALRPGSLASPATWRRCPTCATLQARRIDLFVARHRGQARGRHRQRPAASCPAPGAPRRPDRPARGAFGRASRSIVSSAATRRRGAGHPAAQPRRRRRASVHLVAVRTGCRSSSCGLDGIAVASRGAAASKNRGSRSSFDPCDALLRPVPVAVIRPYGTGRFRYGLRLVPGRVACCLELIALSEERLPAPPRRVGRWRAPGWPVAPARAPPWPGAGTGGPGFPA